MIHITTTETFKTVENLVADLNKLPDFYRTDTLEVRTYDGWRPMHFKFIKGTFERVVLTLDNLLN